MSLSAFLFLFFFEKKNQKTLDRFALV